MYTNIDQINIVLPSQKSKSTLTVKTVHSGSTSVDYGTKEWYQGKPLFGLRNLPSYAESQRLRKRDSKYRTLTKRQVARLEGREVERKTNPFIPIRSTKLKPDLYITLHKTISIGRFSVYYIGTENSSGRAKTVKLFRPPLLSILENRRVGIEKQILSLLKKPAAIPTLHFSFRYEHYKCLVLEPLYNESLGDKLLYARRLMPNIVQTFMVDMVCAVAFLHGNKIIHRNLTLDSFWIQSNSRLKLTGFNYCAKKNHAINWSSLIYVNTTNFTAPELFKRKHYNRQTDIWALGIIFYRMTSGRFPFYGEGPRELRYSIKHTVEEYNDFFTSKSALLSKLMLRKDPTERIGHHIKTDIAFSNHPYFRGVDWNNAHYQTHPGPPIEWDFAISKDVITTQRQTTEHFNIEDLGSFDASKMRKKPLRIDALKDGIHRFSPAYLEVMFPRSVTSTGDTIDRTSLSVSPTASVRSSVMDKQNNVDAPVSSKVQSKSTSIATSVESNKTNKSTISNIHEGTTTEKRPHRRLSLKNHLLKAFRQFEERVGNKEADVEFALDEYYTEVGRHIEQYERKNQHQNSELQDTSNPPVETEI